jgi:hypothetical protein
MNTMADILVRSIFSIDSIDLLEKIRLANSEEVDTQTRPLAWDVRLHSH